MDVQLNFLYKRSLRDAFKPSLILDAHVLMKYASKNNNWDQLLQVSTIRKFEKTAFSK